MRALFTAPNDDEELSDEEILEIDDALASVANGTVSDDEVKRTIGL